MKIVVTGNMGCGKSTVVQMLLKRLPSYVLFDYDKSVHALYEDEVVQTHLSLEFGTHDRKAISNIVFADPERLQKLREIFDCHLNVAIDKACEAENILLDIPLYYELILHQPSFRFRADHVIAVVAAPELQIERIMSRTPGITEEKIQSILARQLSQSAKAQLADLVIENNGAVDDLEHSVGSLVQDHPEVFDHE